ncbi:MAG: hypothetical protein KJ646_02470 [Nanoarchaeota archaeon]|nr:hypothetical protein [Nanoarchaeota archaeon]MBU4116212.1 hypothetical protein [Nanoarchaeota archaeon]
METKQINLKIQKNLLKAAQSYVENFGYRNIQDLATESMREKIFDKNQFDETFTREEIELIDIIISKTLKNKEFISEKELFKSLK